MNSKMLRAMIPQLNLKGGEFAKMVPAEHQLDMTVQFKYKGRKESYDDIHAFALKDGQFKIILRNCQDYVYTFNAKELKTVFLHNDPFANAKPDEDVNNV